MLDATLDADSVDSSGSLMIITSILIIDQFSRLLKVLFWVSLLSFLKDE